MEDKVSYHGFSASRSIFSSRDGETFLDFVFLVDDVVLADNEHAARALRLVGDRDQHVGSGW